MCTMLAAQQQLPLADNTSSQLSSSNMTKHPRRVDRLVFDTLRTAANRHIPFHGETHKHCELHFFRRTCG